MAPPIDATLDQALEPRPVTSFLLRLYSLPLRRIQWSLQIRRVSDLSTQGDAVDAMAVARVEQGILLNGGVANATLNINNTGTDNRRNRTLLEALDFSSRGYRENTVENAHGHTCEWLLQNKQYRAWVASRDSNKTKHRLLWIKGKAGSGKSTIMKFALKTSRGAPDPEPSHEPGVGIVRSTASFFRGLFGYHQQQQKQRDNPRDLVISHFFNSRAKEQLDKSAEGMYRNLLIQILKRVPRLEETFGQLQQDWMPTKGSSWPIPKLEELLNTAVANLDGRPVVFYVDALDECSKDEIRQMIQVFADLVKNSAHSQQTVRVCFASRPYPVHKTRGAVYLDLSRVEEHNQDIAAYVDARLHIGSSSAARKVRRRLLGMAQGVFLWVKMVVERLNDEYSAGRPDRYARWLSGAHGELRLLYKDILDRGMSDADKEAERRNKQATIVCFLVFSFSYDGLTPRQLVCAIEEALSRENEEGSQTWQLMDKGTIKRYVTNTSHGLLECVDDDEPFRVDQVQFIHESAHIFMLSEDGLARLLELETLDEVELHAHEMLRTICDRALRRALMERSQLERYLEWETWFAKRHNESNTDISVGHHLSEHPERMSFIEKHSMLTYARRWILVHTDTVQRHNSNNQDQGLWLSQLYETHGHIMMNRLWQSYRRHIIIPQSFVNFLILNDLDALMLASWPLLVQDAREARQHRRAPGIRFGSGLGQRWLSAGLGPGCDNREDASAAQCLVELYLEQLEPVSRPAPVQEVLQQLADTWEVEQEATELGPYGSAVRIADISEKLALFFLIALIPAEKIDESVVEAITEHASAGFVETLGVLLERNISSDFLELGNRADALTYLEWSEESGHAALSAILRSRGIGRGSGILKRAVAAYQSSRHSSESSKSGSVYTQGSEASQSTFHSSNASGVSYI
ncbi:hypothetical protein CC79DRAFT_808206 [Sarocladium strictum]